MKFQIGCCVLAVFLTSCGTTVKVTKMADVAPVQKAHVKERAHVKKARTHTTRAIEINKEEKNLLKSAEQDLDKLLAR